MVVTVMAAALHLIKTVRANPVACQPATFRTRVGEFAVRRQDVDNRAVFRKRIHLALAAALLLGLPYTGMARAHGIEAATGKTVRVSAQDRVDINHASLRQLLAVPGMTQSWAERIIRFRPYHAKNNLVKQGVVSGEVYARIKDSIVAHRKPEPPAR
jgi:hypothetical protein